MAKPININLFDQKSIQAAVKAIRDYENSLTYKCRLLAEKLAKKGIEVARMQVTSLDAIFTGDLMRSIHAEYVGNIKGVGIWAVVADDESAVFVEFGTLGSLGEKKNIHIRCRKVFSGTTEVVQTSFSWQMVNMDGFTKAMMEKCIGARAWIADHLCI